MSTSAESVALTPLGGPSVLIEAGGVRFLVDPTFDAAGEYPVGSRVLVKTTDAVWTQERVGHVDAVLLSHDQHPDNLDHGGRAYLASRSPLTLTTPVAAERLGGTAVGLRPWEARRVGEVTVTAVPAQHGPEPSPARHSRLVRGLVQLPGTGAAGTFDDPQSGYRVRD